MKKFTKSLMTFALLLVGITSASAQETKLELVHETDWSTKTSYGFGWNGVSAPAELSVVDGLLTVYNPKATDDNYAVQYFGDDGIGLEAGEKYVVKITAKSDVDGNVVVGLGNWTTTLWKNFDVTGGEDLQEFTLNFEFEDDLGGAHVMLQTGFLVGTVQYGKVSVYKEVKEGGEEEPDVDPGLEEIPEGKINIFTNGDLSGDDVHCFAVKIYPDGAAGPVEITADAGRADGAGLKFTSSNAAPNPWDSQFWVIFDQPIEKGQTFHIAFDYKASETTSIPSQQQGKECNYLSNNDVPFTLTASNKWKHVSKDVTATVNMQSLAFNLNDIKDKAIDFFFDNFVVYTDAPKEIVWAPITENADLSGSTQHAKKDAGMSTKAWIAEKFDEGGEHGDVIKVVSNDRIDGDGSLAWDAQFFISVNKQLPKSTKVKVEFDYKADIAAKASTQCHAAPGDYLYYQAIGDVNFTDEWQKFSDTFIVPGDANNMWTIAFNLSESNAANAYYFDNITVSVDEDILGELVDVETPYDITLPETYDVKVDGGYCTYTTPYSIKINKDEVKAYYAIYDAESKIVKLTQIEDIYCGAGVILDAATGEYTGEVERLTARPVNNGLIVSDGSSKSDGSTYYVLAMPGDESTLGFYKLAADAIIPAGKSYLKIEAPAEEAREFIPLTGEATAIAAAKRAVENDAIYNLAGQRLVKAQKGLNIVNGKKIMK